MEITAQLKHYRQSARKMRLVLDMIRGLEVQDALSQLQFLNKRAARSVAKLLHSAIANARHNYSLELNSLYIKKVYANEKRTLKRWKPRAFGRAAPIRKRSCSVNLVLANNLDIETDKTLSKQNILSLNNDKKSYSNLHQTKNKDELAVFEKKTDFKKEEEILTEEKELKIVKDLKEIKQNLEKETIGKEQKQAKDQIFKSSQYDKKPEIIDVSREGKHRYSEQKQEKSKGFGKFKGFVKRVFTRKTG